MMSQDRPCLMVRDKGSAGNFSVKFKIVVFNNLITVKVFVENQAVLHEIQQLGYLNSKLMPTCWPLGLRAAGGHIFVPIFFLAIPSQCERADARNLAHIYLHK